MTQDVYAGSSETSDGKVFTCRHEQNRKRFVCMNSHPVNAPGSGVQIYKYTVNLRGPLPVNPLDPFMVND